MGWFRPTTLLDKIFEGSLLLKGLSAVLETIGAILLLTVPSKTAMDLARFVTQRELFEDPRDIISAALINTTDTLWSSGHAFAIIFLLIHAAVKFVIVIGLLKNLSWAYPFSFITLALIIAYQCYDLIVNFTIGMTLLTVFDIFIVWLVWREYKKLPPDGGSLNTETAT